MPYRITRAAYADMFGPTVGDLVRLADTELTIRVERDLTVYGEEVKFGGGKVIRDGMGQSQHTNAEGAVDTVITNALIVDHWGIVKADVGGSVEALSDALLKLRTDEVAVNIIHSGVGAITESDVMLARASDAIILGFQVRPTSGARVTADQEDVDIRTYSVIYSAIEDVRDALEGLLSPKRREETKGYAEVRDTFSVPDVGMVAGCYVTDGKISRNDRIRVVRDGVVIYEGDIASLKRFEDDVKEVQNGYECGLSIEGYDDIKVDDELEAYVVVEEKRKLEEV